MWLSRLLVLEMLGIWQSRAGSGGTESPLASQLQQAWLQSQIQLPRSHPSSRRQSPRLSQAPSKYQKRGCVLDVSAEREAHSHEEYHQVPSDLLSIVADHSGLQNYAVTREDLYFHKSRHETPEFPKRPVFPQLVSYSRKADVPQRSLSSRDLSSEFGSSSSLSGHSSQRSDSLSPSGSFTSGDFRGSELDDALDAVDSRNEDLEAKTEPLVRFLDGILDMDENAVEETKLTLEGDSEYQAIAKEFAKEFDDLVRVPSDALEICGSPDSVDAAYDNSWTIAGNLPTEDSVAERFIHAYTCNLNKHVNDVSGNVDASTWVNERDACTDHSDESWDWEVQCIQASKSDGDRRRTQWPCPHYDFSASGREMSLNSFSFTPGCVDLKGLLLRYVIPLPQFVKFF